MRRILPVGLALVGMALAMPVAATAGSPDMKHGLFVKRQKRAKQAETTPAPAPPRFIRTEDGRIVPTMAPAPVDHVHTADVPCTTCEAAAAPPTVIMEGACAACEKGATTVHAHPVVEESPGAASIRPRETPGYAQVGGATQVPMYAEPTPIGVMQTSYQPRTQQGQFQPNGLQAPVDVLALSEAREKQKRQAAAVPPTMGGSPGKPRSRPRILAHLFGFDGMFHMGRDREAQRAGQHAAISYGGMNQVVTDVPASAVYGNGGH